ncbi:MAG: hypothetical protein KC416_06025, partial [Myxococcales bacterium]|nr:hypothetical protein [Myxococcales bacterium]
ILSRDKAGDVDGHFTLFVHPEGNFYVRYQKMLSATTSLEYLICTTPFPPDEWHHLAINFGEGPLELFVDGRRAPFEGQLAGLPRLCGDGNPEYGIDGAPGVPWTLGADASCLGCPEPVNQYLRGAIDELRISKVRRDFDL